MLKLLSSLFLLSLLIPQQNPPSYRDCKPNNFRNVCVYFDLGTELTPSNELPNRIQYLYPARIRIGVAWHNVDTNGRYIAMITPGTSINIRTDTSGLLVDTGVFNQPEVHKYIEMNRSLTITKGNQRILLLLKVNPVVEKIK